MPAKCPAKATELIMNSQRILGIILLVGGIIALMMGMNASESVVDQVSKTFTGRFTEATTWYILGGSVSAVLGLVMLFTGMRTRRA